MSLGLGVGMGLRVGVGECWAGEMGAGSQCCWQRHGMRRPRRALAPDVCTQAQAAKGQTHAAVPCCAPMRLLHAPASAGAVPGAPEIPEGMTFEKFRER